MKPTPQEILQILFDPANIIAVELKPQTPYSMAFDMSFQPLNGYLLYCHPWGRFQHHFRTFHFPKLKFIGSIVAFKWFSYQHYAAEAQALLKTHLASAFADRLPVNILIDNSPPTENPQYVTQIMGGISGTILQERPLAEILPFYKPIRESELNDFIATWHLPREIVRIIDLTQKQSVVDGVLASIEFFKTHPK